MLLLIAAFAAASGDARAAATPQFAPGFSVHTVQAGGRTIYYRIGGRGPAVLLLHGYGDTGQMWAAFAPVLAKTHTVIVPDLPGLGNSRPETGNAQYDMASVARSMHALMQQLNVRREAIVGHDIGLMVAFAYAAQFRKDVTKLALMDAPIPGVEPWHMRVGFTYFKDFDADAPADAMFAKTPLRIPVLAMGGEKSMGALMPQFAKSVAVNVRTSVNS